MLTRELFALLEQTADAAYAASDDGEICSWNGVAERLFGYPASEVLHKNVDDVLRARDALGTPALAGGPETMTRRCDGASGGIPNFDLEVRTRSGTNTARRMCTSDAPEPHGGRRDRLRPDHPTRSDVLLPAEHAVVTLNSIADGVITSDAAGTITYLTPIAERLTGWHAVEALGNGNGRCCRPGGPEDADT